MGRLVDGTLNPSVIYSSYMQQIPKQVPLTRPAPLSELAADWLKRGGVDKVVVGHQPVGDAPLVMRAHDVKVRDQNNTTCCSFLLTTDSCLCSRQLRSHIILDCGSR